MCAGTLERLAADLGADTPVVEVTRERLEARLRDRYGATESATYDRQVATIGSLFAWCEDRELVESSGARKLCRRKPRRSKTAERQGQVITLDVLQA